MNIKIVNISKIKKFNFLKKEEIPDDNQKLKESLMKNGFIYPIICSKKNDEIFIVDGIKRLSLAKDLKFNKIPVIFEYFISERLSFLNHIKYNLFREYNEIEIAYCIDKAIKYFKDELLARYILILMKKNVQTK